MASIWSRPQWVKCSSLVIPTPVYFYRDYSKADDATLWRVPECPFNFLNKFYGLWSPYRIQGKAPFVKLIRKGYEI